MMNWKLRPLNKWTIGNWIDAESYIKNNDILALVPLLYRNPNDGTVPDISDWDYNSVIGAFNHYIKWRNTILMNYSELFENNIVINIIL